MKLMEGMLFVEPVKVVGGWLWHSGRIGNELAVLVGLWREEQRVGRRILVVRQSPLHCVVNLSRQWLL
jgi:hypothetical protein